MMSDWDIFATFLEKKTPFAFSKFNDGEISLIRDEKGIASRGFQPNHRLLSEKLKSSLFHRQKNYYVGVPCSQCYPEMREYCKEVENFTLANVLINSNVNKTCGLLKNLSRVVYVCSENAKTENLPFKPYFIYKVPNTDAWSCFEEVKYLYLSLRKGDVVVLACGPLGRVLVYEWFSKRPDITFLELGSFFDPLTTGKSYLYQEGILPYCSECNPELLETLPFDTEKCVHREVIQFGDWNSYAPMFKNHFPSLCRLYTRHLGNDRDRNYYCYVCIIRTIELEKVMDKTLEVSKEYPERVEHVVEAISRLQDKECQTRLYELILDLPVPKNGTYVQNFLYEWKILDDYVIFSYYNGKHEESYEAWKKLMSRNSFPDCHRERITDNGRYAKLYIDEKLSYNNFLKELDNHPCRNETHDRVPRFFHFIYIAGGMKFNMTHFLAIKTCFVVQKPDRIFLYNDREPVENEWWDKAKEYCTVIKTTIPTCVNRRGIYYKQHQADLMRVNILEKIGGVYMDLDLLSLKPIDGSVVKPLYENKGDRNMYEEFTVMCRESSEKLCNCFIVSRKGNPFLQKWIYEYENRYGEDKDYWGGLSVVAPNRLAETNKEIISILDRRVFLPFLYNDLRFFSEDISESLGDSFGVHLWETEADKRGLIPGDREYFKNNDNTFTKLFESYI
jgi:mannosyltransferase OCH1-like enzyme